MKAVAWVVGFMVFLAVIAAILIFMSGRAENAAKEALLEMESGAVLLFSYGSVKVKTSGSQEWIDAAEEMVLLEGYLLRTGADSWAEIGFGRELDNAARIKAGTLVSFKQLSPIRIELLKGDIRSLVEKLSEGSSFEVHTPSAVCGARGTGWDTWTDGEQVIAEVFENKIYFQGRPEGMKPAPGLIIRAGRRGVLRYPAGRIKIESIKSDKKKDWHKWKADFKKRRDKKRGIIVAEEKQSCNPVIDTAPKSDQEHRKGVWVEETDDGDFQLMIETDSTPDTDR